MRLGAVLIRGKPLGGTAQNTCCATGCRIQDLHLAATLLEGRYGRGLRQ